MLPEDLGPPTALEGLEASIVAMVLLAIFVALGARRLRLPYTVAMVLTGLGVSILNLGLGVTIHLEPDLILLVFLPGLLFESAYHLNLKEVRTNLRSILLLAVPGVLLSMTIIGLLLYWLLDLRLADALLFGVLISATDPIAVTALFKELGVEKRLNVLVEGESLLNDGVAVVMYGILLTLATGQQQEIVITQGIAEFLVTVVGGAGLGLLIGVVIAQLMRHQPDHLIDLALTTIAAYGTYLFAELILSGSVSPVIAVVTVGLYIGNYSEHSATSDVTIVSFWEFIAFLLNSFVFLLIGLDVEPANLLRFAAPLGIAIAVILFARVVVVYLMFALVNWRGRPIPWAWSHVLVWGGLRGAVSMALALSIPATVQSRQLLSVLAFGYVLFSLVVQGLTIKPLLVRLGLTQMTEEQRRYQMERGRLAMAQATIRAINEMEDQEAISHQFAARVRERYFEDSHVHWDNVRDMLRVNIRLADSNRRYIEREIASKQRTALMRLARLGILSEEPYEELVQEIDRRLEDGHILTPAMIAHGLDIPLPPEFDEEDNPGQKAKLTRKQRLR